MAGADGQTPDHLSFLRAAAREPKRWGFLALLRKAEARAPELPRIGRSRLPVQNIADLAQTPDLVFPASTVCEIEPGPGGRQRVRSLFLGLTGPMGALPLHLTEYAFYERRNSERRPFGRWLDVLTDRMLQFFYRAWADTQPAAQADRPDDDRFARYVAALSGAGDGADALEDVESFTRTRRLHYAGAFVSRRNASVLCDALSHLLKRPVSIREFIPRWRDVEPADRTRLSSAAGGAGGYNRLGMNTVLGARVRQADDTFRVVVRATCASDYRQLLPGQPAYAAAREAIRALAPSHLGWELELELEESKAEGARLDGLASLGLMCWLTPKGRPGVIRAEARIRN